MDGGGKNHDGKGMTIGGKTRSEPFDGYCNWCKKHGRQERDCWAREREAATGSASTAERAVEAVPATAGSLPKADQVEYESDKGPGRIFAVGRNTHVGPEDILIDSGAAMSV